MRRSTHRMKQSDAVLKVHRCLLPPHSIRQGAAKPPTHTPGTSLGTGPPNGICQARTVSRNPMGPQRQTVDGRPSRRSPTENCIDVGAMQAPRRRIHFDMPGRCDGFGSDGGTQERR
jgi:hypothetical protein